METEPTSTSSTGVSLDCKTALQSALSPGYTLVSSNCNQFPAGTSDYMRGGCKSTATICRSDTGIQTNHEVVLDCTAPNCSDNGGGGGGDGDNGCAPDQIPPYCGTGVPVINCQCGSSPIVIDISGNGFDLTNSNNGVQFDIDADGRKDYISWTNANSDDGWLALDRNSNGFIDNGKELFGNYTDQLLPPNVKWKNGFLALAVFDKPENGGNADGQIDNRDAVFFILRLWLDKNHNGISDADELKTLASVSIAIIELNYKESKRTDEYGNRFKYRAKVKDTHGSHVGRWAWDVFLIARKE